MAAPFNVDEDLLLVDGLRTVQVKAYDPGTDAHAAAVDCRALKRAGKASWAAAEGGEVRGRTTVYHLYAADLAARPTLRSLVVDGSDTWVVDLVDQQVFDGRYRCEVTRA